MGMPVWFEVAFWSAACVVSGFLGWFCFEIHEMDRSCCKGARKVQQIWLNFLGGVVGWAALWLLLHQWWGLRRIPASSVQMTASDFGLALVAFVGISGYLPYAVIGAIQSSVALIRSLLQRALKWLFPAAE